MLATDSTFLFYKCNYRVLQDILFNLGYSHNFTVSLISKIYKGAILAILHGAGDKK